MKIDIMTLFPDTMQAVLGESILGRAARKGILDIRCVQIRDYTANKQCQVDDYPYGGGWGCVMMAQPLKSCLDDIMSIREGNKSRIIYMSPQGAPFTQETAKRLVRDYDHLVLICGHYEGIDERFIERCVDEEISLGDFVLTGGEIAAMAVTDAVCRLVPGVLADAECYTGESHWDGLLEYPQYTRPEVWEGMAIPEVLKGGNHAEVDCWRRKQSIARTLDKRPDMLEKCPLTDARDRRLLAEILEDRQPKPQRLVFDVRSGTPEDGPAIACILEEAKQFLRQEGVDQWQRGYPRVEDFLRDMEEGRNWVFTHEGEVVGVLALSFAPEFCYEMMQGQWLTEGCYASLHRVAVRDDMRGSGLAEEMFSFARDIALGRGASGLRIDTHPDNKPMQGLLRKMGFSYCGKVYLEDHVERGAMRLAFEKVL